MIIILAGGICDACYQIYATAFIIFLLPHSIFAVSIFTALLPAMAERWSGPRPRRRARSFLARTARHDRGDRAGLVRVHRARGADRLVAAGVRVGAGRRTSRLIARTLQGFAVGLPFFSAFQLITRTFYATQDSRTPALVNIGAAIVTVVGRRRARARDRMGHARRSRSGTRCRTRSRPPSGLALLRPKLGSLDGRRVGGTIARAVPAAAITAGIAWLVAAGLGSRRRHPAGGRAARAGGAGRRRGDRCLSARGAHVGHGRGR